MKPHGSALQDIPIFNEAPRKPELPRTRWLKPGYSCIIIHIAVKLSRKKGKKQTNAETGKIILYTTLTFAPSGTIYSPQRPTAYKTYTINAKSMWTRSITPLCAL